MVSDASREDLAHGRRGSATIFEMLASSQERHVLLTFDDGGKSAVRIADLLEEQGWRGHFFITTAMIGEPGFVHQR